MTRAPRLVLWGIALLAAAALRFPHLLDETPHFDEWHPLLAVKRMQAANLATSFGTTDRSIPVSLYLEALTRTVGLSDLSMRLPFALFGMAALVAIPLAARAKGEPAMTAPALALMLALSPLLVYYSRAIRPYGVTVLFGWLGVLALRRALEKEVPGRWLWLYVLLAALVGWFLPVHLPFVGAPLLLAIAWRWREHGFRAAAPLAGAALATGLALLLLLGPAILRDSGAVSGRWGVSGFELSELLQVPRQLCGTSSAAFGYAWLGFAVAGAVFASRRREWGARLLIAGAVGQIVAVAAARPWLADVPIVLSRYLLPVAVVGWWLVIDLLQRAIERRWTLRPELAALGAPLALGFALFWSGPLHGWLGPGPDNFASTRLHDRIGGLKPDGSAGWPPAPPPAYRAIERLPARSAAVLEVPYTGYLAEPYAYYQLAHHQDVFVGVTFDFCSPHGTIEIPWAGHGGFELRRLLFLGDIPTLRENGIRFVILHRHTEKKVGETYLKDWFFDFDRCVDAFARLSGVAPAIDDRVAFFDLGPAR